MSWVNRLKKYFTRNKKKNYDIEDLDLDQITDLVSESKIKSNLNENVNQVKIFYGNSFDLNIRRFKIGKQKINGAIIYMSGLVDSASIENILNNLEIDYFTRQPCAEKTVNIYETIKTSLLNNKRLEETDKLEKVVDNISTGSSALFLDGVDKALLCDTQGIENRAIEEPESEMTLRGPREGFIENIFVNTSLIRKRIRVSQLWIQNMEIGSLSKTNVAVAYIKGLASEELVEEVKTRLKQIDIDNVLESGYLQEYLKDEPYTLFPLMERTERPDKVISCLVEGRVAVLTNNTPFVLIAPTTYNMLLQAPDDYYENFPVGSFVRILRHSAFLISLLLPGIYVAIVNFHTELLPISLLMRIAATREIVPFPVIIESLLMESLFEVLREAGLRLPKAIGSAISIVGALVLGEAAISAGLVSPPMVIIVAITAIASFTTPDYNLATAARVLRYVFIILGSTFGLFGIQFGVLLLIIHLCSLRSFGQPYMQPFAPLILQDLKDSIIRLFWWQDTTRPQLMGGRNIKRQQEGQKPETPEEENNNEK